MKKEFENFTGVVIILTLIIIYSSPVMAIKLKGTPHDLSGEGDMTKICQSCHISGESDEAKSLINPEVNEDTYSKMQEILGLSSSLFCAQCHDGTISHRNIGNATESFSSNMGNKSKNISFGNHPVNADYPQAKGDFKAAPGLKLYGPNHNKVKCNTCHDPHQAGTGSFLRKKEDLCENCHDK